MRKLVPLVLALLLSCTPLKLARDSYELGDYKKTVSECKKALVADSTDTNSLALLGAAYHELGLIDSARTIYQKAFEMNPDRGKIREKYYQATLARGAQLAADDPKAALACFDVAISIDSTLAAAFEKRGAVYFQQKKYEAARQQYLLALTKAGASAEVQERLALIATLADSSTQIVAEGKTVMAGKNYARAVALFSRALAVRPDDKEARYQLHIATGLAQYKKGSVDALWEALDNFGRAAILFPERGEPHYYSGLAYNKKDKNEYDNAVEALQKAVTVEPSGVWAAEAQKEAERILARKKKMQDFMSR